jgi:hypothetical protein
MLQEAFAALGGILFSMFFLSLLDLFLPVSGIERFLAGIRCVLGLLGLAAFVVLASAINALMAK